MSNPYTSTPHTNFTQSANGDEIKGPAIALMVVSILCLAITGLGLIVDIVGVLALGILAPDIMVRIIWGVVLLFTSSFVLFGAIRMIKKKDHGIAKAASIVAIIPFLGPCCLLGIPFGIWALVVLNKPHVRSAFDG